MVYLCILKRARALVVQALCVLWGILFGIQICYCDVTWSKYYKRENTRLTTAVYDQIERVTDLDCWSRCHSDSSCNSVNYNPGTEECQLSTTYSDSDREISNEWVAYSTNKPICTNYTYLVSGPNLVPDSQLTQSNYYCMHHSCVPQKGYSARYARLNDKGWETGGWFTESNAGEYIQVDFLNPRTMSAIALQNHDSRGDYVTSFKVLTSMDGVDFMAITDQTGIDKIFEGNSAVEAFVIRYLPESVSARYVRIQPVTWNIDIALRFDIVRC